MAHSGPNPHVPISCPICLVSSNDDAHANEHSSGADAESTVFVKTPCSHTFCLPCIERVLLKPTNQNNGIPTRAPCPMCRVTVNLFDLCHVHNQNGNDDMLVFGVETGVSTWPIANTLFEQKPLIPVANPNEFLLETVDARGIIQGYGIKFHFKEPGPFLEFMRPLKSAITGDNNNGNDNDGDDTSQLTVLFDKAHFHSKSMTFHGKSTFFKPIQCNVWKNKYSYDQLECLLRFSENGQYIRRGELRWRYTLTASTDASVSYPLDGVWEVQYDHGETVIIYVQRHYFTCYRISYQISIDSCKHQPRFVWSDGTEQTSNLQIPPGTSGPNVDEILEWTTNYPGYEFIRWKRLSMNLDDQWKSVDIAVGNFVYQRVNEDSRDDDDQPLGPSHNADNLWGNTFCQMFCVGLASYHFLEEKGDNDNYQAYISYENPRTEAWPDLDNGNAVPSRVPFRNIQWNPDTITFKGDICWQEDYGTTWMNESKWSYEIKFDPKFMFVVSGTVSRALGQAHQFGVDLVYVNAALETLLNKAIDESESTGTYLDILRRWRDEDNASPSTMQMLGEVAMNVMGGGESIFDFNL